MPGFVFAVKVPTRSYLILAFADVKSLPLYPAVEGGEFTGGEAGRAARRRFAFSGVILRLSRPAASHVRVAAGFKKLECSYMII
ncbi:hypothetical protein TMO_a0491 (plasmid) [Tistrella mobilis KA081020-065]|uniref:Uncharacterized protein n=1 Tax=Tistrella mobilis (strain KA081020-065) TaxID=1110502 RepID=I3TT06_TISMK|nr:hypothetical protein TMO_a0491 [Tistrella mobilis KA081020-065]